GPELHATCSGDRRSRCAGSRGTRCKPRDSPGCVATRGTTRTEEPMLDHQRADSLAESLPETLRPLLRLATNLWWTWNNNSFALFRDIDHERWEASEHNPLKLLRMVSQER